MSHPENLWVWIGSPDDKLDVMRYVKATDADVLRHPAVVSALSALEAEVARLVEERRLDNLSKRLRAKASRIEKARGK